MFRACTYDIVIHKSENILIVCVHDCDSCLLQATCGRLAVDITARARLEGSLLGTECFRDYIVSIRVSLEYRF